MKKGKKTSLPPCAALAVISCLRNHCLWQWSTMARSGTFVPSCFHAAFSRIKTSHHLWWWYLTAALLSSAPWSCAPLTDPGYYRIHITSWVQGNGAIFGIPGDTMVSPGDILKLTAVPAAGSVFAGWSGIDFTTENPLTVVVAHNLSIAARFAAKPGKLAAIRAYDSVFSMGSAGALSQEYEKPVHTVRFKHDFFIGNHEVTQGEYAGLVGRIPNTDAGAVDIGDSFPVYNVTWYDAALYCNKLSKAEGYDTVYSYTALCSDPACPFVLENLDGRIELGSSKHIALILH